MATSNVKSFATRETTDSTNVSARDILNGGSPLPEGFTFKLGAPKNVNILNEDGSVSDDARPVCVWPIIKDGNPYTKNGNPVYIWTTSYGKTVLDVQGNAITLDGAFDIKVLEALDSSESIESVARSIYDNHKDKLLKISRKRYTGWRTNKKTGKLFQAPASRACIEFA